MSVELNLEGAHKWRHAILYNFWHPLPFSYARISLLIWYSQNHWPTPLSSWRHLWTTPYLNFSKHCKMSNICKTSSHQKSFWIDFDSIMNLFKKFVWAFIQNEAKHHLQMWETFLSVNRCPSQHFSIHGVTCLWLLRLVISYLKDVSQVRNNHFYVKQWV